MLHRVRMLAAAVVFLAPALAQASPIVYTAILNGPSESPVNASPGIGFAKVTLDTAADILRVEVSFSNLIGNTTASHIHCCTAVAGTGTAGVATQTPTFTGFPLGVKAGAYDNTFDTSLLSTYNDPAFSAGDPIAAEAKLALGLADGKAYLNIHSSLFPGGEIRGFLTPQAVPEPTSMLLLGTGVAGLIARRARRRRS